MESQYSTTDTIVWASLRTQWKSAIGCLAWWVLGLVLSFSFVLQDTVWGKSLQDFVASYWSSRDELVGVVLPLSNRKTCELFGTAVWNSSRVFKQPVTYRKFRRRVESTVAGCLWAQASSCPLILHQALGPSESNTLAMVTLGLLSGPLALGPR